MRWIPFRRPQIAAGLFVVAVVGAATPRLAANAPPGHYTIPGDGTVYDTKTGLTWQQAVPGQAYSQSGAISYCNGNTVGLPGGPWRLPNMKELQTIVDESQAGAPAIDQTAFPGVNSAPALFFWTSSPMVGTPSTGWYVRFTDGITGGAAVTQSAAVRCVR
jgi:hypothetical protein